MRTTTAIFLVLLLAAPSVARSHPCEAELAAMRKDLESIRKAVTTIEAVPPGDTRDQMLTGAKARYDLEQRRIKEKQAACDALVAAENPGAVAVAVPANAPPAPAAASPSAPTNTPPEVAPGPARVEAPAPIVAPATAPAAVIAPTVEAVRPAAPVPATPCLTGCGKDTDCKGARICVKGECVDPPEKKN